MTAPLRIATRAVTSAVARCRCTGVQCLSGFVSAASTLMRTSRRCVGLWIAGSSTQSPRLADSRSAPREIQRAALARHRLHPPLCPESGCARTRTAVPAGETTSLSPVFTTPLNTVPVTTVPLPAMVNARSIASLKCWPAVRRAACAAASRASSSRSSAIPAPLTADSGSTGIGGEPGGGEQGFDVVANLPHARFIDAVDFRDHGGAARDVQQVENVEVLDGLRHHAVVGGHHQQREIDAAHAGEHVADEALVTGNVDEADQLPARQRQIGEPEVDRNAARLLLRQAVGVDAGERFHQQRLAVVDVSGGGDDHLVNTG